MATVQIFRPQLNALLSGRQGPVVLHQANAGRQVAGAARRLAPRGNGPGPHLADSITSELVRTSRGFVVRVSANRPYAVYVHQGTRPHSIGSAVPVEPGVFRYIGLSPAGKGKIHPGYRGNPFLLKAARSVGLDARAVR